MDDLSLLVKSLKENSAPPNSALLSLEKIHYMLQNGHELTSQEREVYDCTCLSIAADHIVSSQNYFDQALTCFNGQQVIPESDWKPVSILLEIVDREISDALSYARRTDERYSMFTCYHPECGNDYGLDAVHRDAQRLLQEFKSEVTLEREELDQLRVIYFNKAESPML